MPPYHGAANSFTPSGPGGPFASVLRRGQSAYLFGLPTKTPPIISDANLTLETVAAGTASIPLCIASGEPSNSPPMITVELRFSGAPGAFELDVQEADTDADGFYVTPSAVAYQVTAVDANQVARVDLSPTGGKFLRVLMKTLTNAVNTSVKVSRLA